MNSSNQTGLPVRDRLNQKSFNGVLVQIVGPILIMLMIGALVFFLIEVFYRGPHAGRLGWVLGLFTIAAVLVSRISIEEGLERAALFGFALAIATLFVTVSLVDFEYGELFALEPVVTLLFIGIVMWSSNRLTWDCTVIDSSRDVSSIGLAEHVKRGLLNRQNRVASKRTSTAQSDKQSQTKNESLNGPNRFLFMFFANAKSQNTPGLWVFYFAIAAFPIFGFGQWFAQADSDWGYRWIFLLFAVYLGSALGLLMLTSLMGLERYLKKRGADLPTAVSINWVGVGTVFALIVMVVMMLLPSPNISNGWQDTLAFLVTKNKETSRLAVGNDGQEEGEDAKNQKRNQDEQGDKQVPGEKGKGKGDQGKGGDGKSDQSGDDSSGGKKSKQNSNSKSDSKSKTDANADDSDSQQSKNPDRSRDKNSDDSSRDQNRGRKQKQPDADQNNKANGKKNGDRQNDQQRAEPDKAEKQAKNQPKPPKQPQGKQNNSRGQQGNALSKLAKLLGGFLKYAVYVVGLIVLVVTLWLFRDELANLWAQLFGKKETQNEESKKNPVDPGQPKKSLASFSQFREPFSSGLAKKWPAAKTIQYTFQALEAWGRGHQLARDHDQTPLEFAKQLTAFSEPVSNESRKLAKVFGESLYGDQSIDHLDVAKLETLWRLMIEDAPTPSSQVTQLVHS